MLSIGRIHAQGNELDVATEDVDVQRRSGKITRSLFLAVLEERYSLDLCAYPACQASPCRPQKLASSRSSSSSRFASGSSFRIDIQTRSVVPETRMDVGGMWTFCSEACWARATWIRRWILGDDGDESARVQGRQAAMSGNASGGRWEVVDHGEQSIELLEDLEQRGEVELPDAPARNTASPASAQLPVADQGRPSLLSDTPRSDKSSAPSSARNASASAVSPRRESATAPQQGDRPRNPHLPKGMSTVRKAPSMRQNVTAHYSTTASVTSDNASTSRESSRKDGTLGKMSLAEKPAAQTARDPISCRLSSTVDFDHVARDRVPSIFSELRIVERGREVSTNSASEAQQPPAASAQPSCDAPLTEEPVASSAGMDKEALARQEDQDLARMLADHERRERESLGGHTSEDLWDFAKLARQELKKEPTVNNTT